MARSAPWDSVTDASVQLPFVIEQRVYRGLQAQTVSRRCVLNWKEGGQAPVGMRWRWRQQLLRGRTNAYLQPWHGLRNERSEHQQRPKRRSERVAAALACPAWAAAAPGRPLVGPSGCFIQLCAALPPVCNSAWPSPARLPSGLAGTSLLPRPWLLPPSVAHLPTALRQAAEAAAGRWQRRRGADPHAWLAPSLAAAGCC